MCALNGIGLRPLHAHYRKMVWFTRVCVLTYMHVYVSGHECCNGPFKEQKK